MKPMTETPFWFTSMPVDEPDMAADEKRSICPCGSGTLDFKAIYEVCKQIGVKNVLVEQDNAAKTPDPLGEMQKSFAHLRPIIK